MNLAETQALFWTAATQAPGSNAGVETVLRGTPGLSAQERIGIYAEMFIWRQLETLREDFPKLWAVLGDDAFDAIARAYLQAYPSRHPSLAKLGRDLPAFLSRRDLPRSDLVDLAALEWARAEVFEALDCPAMDLGDLTALAPEVLVETRLKLVPGLRRLHLDHHILPLWKAIEDGRPEDAGEPSPGSNRAVVWRKGFDVFHVAVAEDEASALELLDAGEPLAAVCELFSAHPEPAAAAFGAITSWITEGWVSR